MTASILVSVHIYPSCSTPSCRKGLETDAQALTTIETSFKNPLLCDRNLNPSRLVRRTASLFGAIDANTSLTVRTTHGSGWTRRVLACPRIGSIHETLVDGGTILALLQLIMEILVDTQHTENDEMKTGSQASYMRCHVVDDVDLGSRKEERGGGNRGAGDRSSF